MAETKILNNLSKKEIEITKLIAMNIPKKKLLII